jgi:peptide/nickel transport system substrate-binding protein
VGTALPVTLAVAAALAAATPCKATAATVQVPFPRDPGTLTPLTFTLGYPLLTLVYDTITWRDRAGVPRPWLAQSVRATGGGRRIVVRLRKGLRWHDGRALTAVDVAFTYDFMRARRHPRFAPQLRAIESVRATSRRTVVFALRHPAIGFADQPLADVPILPAHRWRGVRPGLRAPAGSPIGSGPYRYAGRRADGGLQLTAVADYFKGTPRAERIEVPIMSEARDMLVALRRGEADTVPFSLTPAQAGSVASVSVRIARGPLFAGTMLLFNTRRAPFDRLALRRQVAAALDLPRIARAAFGSTPATTGPLHPSSRWAPEPEPAARPRVLRGVPELRVLAPANDPVRREAGRQVVLAIQRAGGRAALVPLSRERLGQAVGEGGREASFELAIWGIPPLASHDPDFLAAIFGSRDAGGVLNRSGYASAAFDELAATVAAAPSPPARRQAISALLARLATDVPAVPLLFAAGNFAYRSTSPVGWTFAAGTGILDKQSLLKPAPPRVAARASSPTAPGSANDDDGGISLFGIVGAGMLALALLLGALTVRARRS